MKENPLNLLQFVSTPSSVHHHRPGFMTSFSCPAGNGDRVNGHGLVGTEARDKFDRRLYKRPPSLSSYLPMQNTYLRSARSHLHYPSHSTNFGSRTEPNSMNSVDRFGEINGNNGIISVADAVEGGLNTSGNIRYQANVWLTNKILDTSKNMGGPFI